MVRDGELQPLASQTNPSTSAGVQLNLGIACRVRYFIAKLFRPHSSFSAYVPCWGVLFTQLKPRYLLNSVLEPPREHCSQRSLAATNLPRTSLPHVHTRKETSAAHPHKGSGRSLKSLTCPQNIVAQSQIFHTLSPRSFRAGGRAKDATETAAATAK